MHWNHIIAGYLIVLVGTAAYTWWVIGRGRKLAQRIPEARRRFLG